MAFAAGVVRATSTGSAHGTSAAAIRSTTFGSGTDSPVAASSGTGRQIPAATASVSTRASERGRGREGGRTGGARMKGG